MILQGNEGFANLIDEIPASAHTFYEYKFPYSLLGISKDFIKNIGIGVMIVDTYGQGAIGSTPYDETCFDNVTTPYSKDPSSSMEKEDKDVFTYALARVGKGGGSSYVAPAVPASEITYSLNGNILTLNAENARAMVSGVDGRLVFSGDVKGEQTLILRTGFYVLNLNGRGHTLLVK